MPSKQRCKPTVRPARQAPPDPAGLERRPRISSEVEAKILDAAFRFPAHGQDRIARELRASKVPVSASGVRYVWQRHNLETVEKRIAWIETRLGRNDVLWSKEQLAARDRIRSDRQARSLGAGMVGQHAGEVPRSMHILAVAARLFRELSYEATSLRDIAARSNIPLGSIYYHFQTKEELFAAVYEEGIRRLERAVHEAIGSQTDPWKRLELGCACHLDKLCGGERIGISNGLWPASGLWKARLMHGWPADTGLDGLELTAATSSCRDSAWPLTDRSGLAGPWYQG